MPRRARYAVLLVCLCPPSSASHEAAWSGEQAAAHYHERLVAFQLDEAIPAATYRGAGTASFDPSGDGGGIGDVMQIVAREAQEALSAGCRYRSPHVAHGAAWRYAATAARADLCTVGDGWRCLFGDGFAALPPSDPAWSRVPADATGRFDLPALRAECAAADGLARHQLVLGGGDEESRNERCAPARLLDAASGCGGEGGGAECAARRRAAASIAELVEHGDCSDADWVLAHLISLSWTLAPRVAARVNASVAAAARPLEAAGGKPLPYVGVHMRRGDACKCLRGCCWSNKDGSGRSCPPVEEYVELAADLAEAVGTRSVLVATEDPDDAERGAALLRERGLTPLAQPWARAAYSRATAAGSCADGGDAFTRIEDAMDRHAVDAEGMIISAAADIELLAGASGLVGGISLFTGLAVRLGAARRGLHAPLIDVRSTA